MPRQAVLFAGRQGKAVEGGGSVEETLISWLDGIRPLNRAPTACVCPLIMAGKAAAARDRDVPRPNCYIYAKRGWGEGLGRSRSVMPGLTVLLNPRGPSLHLRHGETLGEAAQWGPNIRHARKTQRAVNRSSRASRENSL